MAQAQFYVHQAGSLALFIGLFLLYGGFAGDAAVGPVLGVASVAVFVGVVLMTVLYMKPMRSA